MLEYGAKAEDPVVSFDGRQSEVAAELQRGVCRTFRALGSCPLPMAAAPTLWRCQETATF
jgi:hypothetical protein